MTELQTEFMFLVKLKKAFDPGVLNLITTKTEKKTLNKIKKY